MGIQRHPSAAGVASFSIVLSTIALFRGESSSFVLHISFHSDTFLSKNLILYGTIVSLPLVNEAKKGILQLWVSPRRVPHLLQPNTNTHTDADTEK